MASVTAAVSDTRYAHARWTREVSASGLAKAERRRRQELTSRAAATSLGRASSDHHGGPSQVGILSLRPTLR
jgi:hypothetical protein